MPLRDIAQYSKFSELPLDRYNTLSISVYVVDYQWNYLFVNDFVKKNLGERGQDLIGKNMWQQFPELSSDPVFMKLRTQTEAGSEVQIMTTSPVNGQRLSITGFVLQDCYFFSSAILPKKEDLLNEIRNELKKKSKLVLGSGF